MELGTFGGCCCSVLFDEGTPDCLLKFFWCRILRTDTLYFDSNSTTSDCETWASVSKPYLNYYKSWKAQFWSEEVYYRDIISFSNTHFLGTIKLYLLHTNHNRTNVCVGMSDTRQLIINILETATISKWKYKNCTSCSIFRNLLVKRYKYRAKRDFNVSIWIFFLHYLNAQLLNECAYR